MTGIVTGIVVFSVGFVLAMKVLCAFVIGLGGSLVFMTQFW